FMLRVKTEVQQCVVVAVGHQNDVAAPSAVAAAGTALGNELLAPEREAPVAAVAGLQADNDFVDKHRQEIAVPNNTKAAGAGAPGGLKKTSGARRLRLQRARCGRTCPCGPGRAT